MHVPHPLDQQNRALEAATVTHILQFMQDWHRVHWVLFQKVIQYASLGSRPTDLVVLGSSHAWSEIFSAINGAPLHTAFHYHLPIFLVWPHPSTAPVMQGYQDTYTHFHMDRFPLRQSRFPEEQLFIGMPFQPTCQSFPPWRSSSALSARWIMCLPKHQFLFLPFNYTNTPFTVYKLISPPLFYALFH